MANDSFIRGSSADLRDLTASASAAVQRLGLGGLEAEVVLILDVSRSMFPIYRVRTVQDLVPQLLALALNFDDDGTIPAYAFGDTCRHLRDLQKSDFAGWVDREVIRTGADYQQGCQYAPVIHDVCRYFFPEDWDRPALKETVGRLFKQERIVYPMLSAPRAYPVFAMFVTGGDCLDEEAAADAIRRSSRLPIFWQFIGLSAPSRLTQYRFLKRLDKLGNTYVDNCGFYEPGDVRNPSALYRGLLNELPDYIRRPEVQAMLRPPELGGLETRGHRDTFADEDDFTHEPPSLEEPLIEEPAPDEPEPERDLDALRQRFAGIEWVEGTHGGAVRSAAPVAREEVVVATPSRRRVRPSELELEAPPTKDDTRQRVAERIARLKSTLDVSTARTTPTGSASRDVATTPAGSALRDVATSPTGSASRDVATSPTGSASRDVATSPTGSASRDVATSPTGSALRDVATSLPKPPLPPAPRSIPLPPPRPAPRVPENSLKRRPTQVDDDDEATTASLTLDSLKRRSTYEDDDEATTASLTLDTLKRRPTQVDDDDEATTASLTLDTLKRRSTQADDDDEATISGATLEALRARLAALDGDSTVAATGLVTDREGQPRLGRPQPPPRR